MSLKIDRRGTGVGFGPAATVEWAPSAVGCGPQRDQGPQPLALRAPLSLKNPTKRAKTEIPACSFFECANASPGGESQLILVMTSQGLQSTDGRPGNELSFFGPCLIALDGSTGFPFAVPFAVPNLRG